MMAGIREGSPFSQGVHGVSEEEEEERVWWQRFRERELQWWHRVFGFNPKFGSARRDLLSRGLRISDLCLYGELFFTCKGIKPATLSNDCGGSEAEDEFLERVVLSSEIQTRYPHLRHIRLRDLGRTPSEPQLPGRHLFYHAFHPFAAEIEACLLQTAVDTADQSDGSPNEAIGPLVLSEAVLAKWLDYPWALPESPEQLELDPGDELLEVGYIDCHALELFSEPHAYSLLGFETTTTTTKSQSQERHQQSKVVRGTLIMSYGLLKSRLGLFRAHFERYSQASRLVFPLACSIKTISE